VRAANGPPHDSATAVPAACSALRGEACVSVVVSDAGRGLDAVHHTDHHKPALLSSDGRDLYVTSRLMDELHVHIDGGTELRTVKRLT